MKLNEADFASDHDLFRSKWRDLNIHLPKSKYARTCAMKPPDYIVTGQQKELQTPHLGGNKHTQAPS